MEGTALAPHRIPKANELFAALDADSKGQMDISVFVNLIDLVAPQLSATEVASTLAVTGEPCRSGALQRRHLYAWLHEVYGELQDCHFNEAMAELIKLAVAQALKMSRAQMIAQEESFGQMMVSYMLRTRFGRVVDLAMESDGFKTMRDENESFFSSLFG